MNDFFSGKEENGTDRLDEKYLIEAMTKIKFDKLRHSCLSEVTSSSTKRAMHQRSTIKQKSILSVRTIDESLGKKTRKGKEISAVTFSSVKIQEYPIIMGDNPSVSSGPPLTIEWTPINTFTYDIDKYEELRKPLRRKSITQLSLAYDQRWYTLLRMGLDPSDIYKCQELAQKERERRLKSLSFISSATFGIQAWIELTYRGMKNVIMRGRKENQREWIKLGLEIDREAFKRRSAALQNNELKDHKAEASRLSGKNSLHCNTAILHISNNDENFRVKTLHARSA